MAMLYAPSRGSKASRRKASRLRPFDREIRWRMSSESALPWKIEPFGQCGADLGAVRNVPVVRERDSSLIAFDDDGLGVLHPRASGGGVSHMPETHPGGMPLLEESAEYLGDHSEIAVRLPPSLLLPGDAAGFLAPMLERKKHIKQRSGDFGRFVREDAGDAAFMAERNRPWRRLIDMTANRGVVEHVRF
jgi:hypothetical protein